MKTEEKECKGCNEILPLGEFWKNKSYPGDLDSLCKDCRMEETLKTRKLMSENIKNKWLESACKDCKMIATVKKGD